MFKLVPTAFTGEEGLVTCGGVNCDTCFMLQSVNQTLNWLVIIAGVAAVIFLMLKFKKLFRAAVIAFFSLLALWLIFHVVLKAKGASYENYWWDLDCTLRTPYTISSSLPTKRPADLLESMKKGGSLSASLPQNTSKEELIKLVNDLPEKTTVVFKRKNNPTELVAAVKKENGKIKTFKKDSSKSDAFIDPLFIFSVKQAKADLISDLFSGSEGGLIGLIDFIIGLIQQNIQLTMTIMESENRLDQVNVCTESGGTWNRFVNQCYLDAMQCSSYGKANSCDPTDTTLVDGCLCPIGSCLEDGKCVPSEASIQFSFPQFNLNNNNTVVCPDPPQGIPSLSEIQQGCAYAGGMLQLFSGTYYCTCSKDSLISVDTCGVAKCLPASISSNCTSSGGEWKTKNTDEAGSSLLGTPSCADGSNVSYYLNDSNDWVCTTVGGIPLCQGTPQNADAVCKCPDGQCLDRDSVTCHPQGSLSETDCSSSGGTWSCWNTKCNSPTNFIKCIGGGTACTCSCPAGSYLGLNGKCVSSPGTNFGIQNCVNSGGTWDNIGGCCGADRQVCGLGNMVCNCASGQQRYQEGCICPTGTCLSGIGGSCVGKNKVINPVSSKEQNCRSTGGVWNCHLRNEVDYLTSDNCSCQCPQGSYLDGNGSCIVKSITPPVTGSERNCTGSGGTWRPMPELCSSGLTLCGGKTVATSCVYSESNPTYGCECPAGTCLSEIGGRCANNPGITEEERKQNCAVSGGNWKQFGNQCILDQTQKCIYRGINMNCSYLNAPVWGCECPGKRLVYHSPSGSLIYGYCPPNAGNNCIEEPTCLNEDGRCQAYLINILAPNPGPDDLISAMQKKCTDSGGKWMFLTDPGRPGYCECPGDASADINKTVCTSSSDGCIYIGAPCGKICPEEKVINESPFSKIDTQTIVTNLRKFTQLKIRTIRKISDTQAEIMVGGCAGESYRATKVIEGKAATWRIEHIGSWQS